MRKVLISVTCAVLLSACASIKDKSDAKVVSEFLGGDIKVTYSKSGEFESLASSASVKVISDLSSAKEEAVSVATVRARRQISEFLKTEVESERFVTTVTKSLQESNAASGVSASTVNSKIAMDVKETIRQKSESLLKGTFVGSEKYDASSKVVTVTVKTGVKETGVANTVRKLMGY